MSLLADSVVERYDSLDALFQALSLRTTPAMPHGGYVRLHPTWLPESRLADCLFARQRLRTFGLRLVVSPAAAPSVLELRRYPAAVP